MENFQVKEYYLASMTPQEAVLELLNKVTDSLKKARFALKRKQYEQLNRLITSSQAVFLELSGMMDGDDEASVKAAKLFDSLADCLFYVNLNQDQALLKEVQALVERLRIIYATEIGRLRLK